MLTVRKVLKDRWFNEQCPNCGKEDCLSSDILLNGETECPDHDFTGFDECIICGFIYCMVDTDFGLLVAPMNMQTEVEKEFRYIMSKPPTESEKR